MNWLWEFLGSPPEVENSNIAFLMTLLSRVCTKILCLSVMAASGRLHVYASSDCQSSVAYWAKKFTTSVDLVHRHIVLVPTVVARRTLPMAPNIISYVLCNCADSRSCHIITLFLHCQQARNSELFWDIVGGQSWQFLH